MPDAPKIESVPPPLLRRGWRLFLFFTPAFLLTGAVSMLFADLLWRTGWSTSRTVLLGLFIILFFLTAVGCMHGVFGFFIRIFGTRQRITGLKPYKEQSIEGTSTAIIFPIYNEDSIRVLEGLRATYESLQRTGQLDKFDFFILSDSTNPDRWIEEEKNWCELVRDLDALGKIYYRRRLFNEARKSGNVRDFLNTWGKRYRYFVCCDADSVMRGETLVDLVKLMEVHPTTGLIQTVPALVNAESLFGRIQQFANRLYAPVFISGLNYWALDFGNYWGHNAIIRTEPFMQFCDLPSLPGRKPFGGQILSHDFVEAALMLRENWQVWLAYDLEGSYEEAPQSLIDNAQRERRWCQGNLQHGLVLFAKGLRGVSRLHLFFGIFGYVASPLWFAFLITFDWIYFMQKVTGLSDILVRSRIGNWSGTAEAFLIFIICMTVIMLPKFLSLIDLARDRQRQKEFGSLLTAAGGVIGETFFSTLHAPLLMLWHTRFVLTNIAGISVGWTTQNRAADGTDWLYALQRHWGHVLIGVLWGWFTWWLEPGLFWWFTPVLAGMVLSIPLSVLTSRRSIGARAKQAGLFLTPEDTRPPMELVSLRSRMAIHELTEEEYEINRCRPHAGLARAVLDPYVNAIHVTLLREKNLNPVYAEQFTKLGAGTDAVRELGEKLLAAGPDKLKSSERIAVMADQRVMVWLHQQAWLRPEEKLAPWWKAMIREFSQREN
jgi:membrane glycosyltransferase